MSRFIIVLLLLAARVEASEVKIHSLCDENMFHIIELEISSADESVGSLTVKALDLLDLQFVGSESAIASIEGSPTGADAIDFKDQKNLRSYGWCYLVSSDNTLPGVMPDAYPIKNTSQNIHWFYAYSEVRNGKWVSFCVPTYETRPEFICG